MDPVHRRRCGAQFSLDLLGYSLIMYSLIGLIMLMAVVAIFLFVLGLPSRRRSRLRMAERSGAVGVRGDRWGDQ
jgi:hypothetical protein